MSLIDKYKNKTNVSNEGFIDIVKGLFGSKSNTYSNLKTVDELLDKLQERYKEVSDKVTEYSKPEVNYSDSYRKYFYTNQPLAKYNDILNLITLSSNYPLLIQQYDKTVVKDILDRSKKLIANSKKLPKDDVPRFPRSIQYENSLWSKSKLFKRCEKNLSLSEDYDFEDNGYRTEFYFDGNYIFTVNDRANLVIERCTLPNEVKLRQNFIEGCKDTKKVLSLVNEFIKTSQYFKSKNSFFELVGWINEVRYDDQLYLFDDYFGNLNYFGNDGYNEIVEVEKILARGMLVALDWVESSISNEKPSNESYPPLGEPL